jgi:hypothetical protein
MCRLLVLGASGLAVGALFVGSGAAATRPTPTSCVLAWDQGVPRYIVHQVVVGHARLAFVAPAIEDDDVPLAHANCTFSFALPHRRMLSVSAVSGDYLAWSRPSIIGLPLSVSPNTIVSPDGTLTFRG